MTRRRPDVTEAELAVLKALWEREPATIRTLTDLLYPGGTEAHYATVKKLLERLEAKGYVGRQRRGIPHKFRTKVDCDAVIGNRLRDVADALCEGSMASLLSTMLQRNEYSSADVKALKDLVRKLEQDRKGGAS